MSGEEALARELYGRSVLGVATYRFAPREELKTAATARPWFETAGVAGAVALRPVAVDARRPIPRWCGRRGTTSRYWGFYDYGWMNVGAVRATGTRTTVIVEMLVFDLRRDKLVWAATSRDQGSGTCRTFIVELVERRREGNAEGEVRRLIGAAAVYPIVTRGSSHLHTRPIQCAPSARPGLSPGAGGRGST